MIVTYGGYTHEGSPGFDAGWDTLYDDKQRPLFRVQYVELYGELKGATQSEIHSKMAALEAAYQQGNQDFLIRLDDTTKTVHCLEVANTYNGVQVPKLVWGSQRKGQFATHRSYTLRVEARYYLGSSGAEFITKFEETLAVEGNGGPDLFVRPLLDGTFDAQTVYPATVVRAEQSGTASGYNFYPGKPPYLFPVASLVNPQARASQTSKTDSGGKILRTTSWNFKYLLTEPVPWSTHPNSA